MTTTLDKIKPRNKAVILKLTGKGGIRKRLLEMGFTAGTEIYVKKHAPLADPVEYVIKGYHLSLRLKEAADIQTRTL